MTFTQHGISITSTSNHAKHAFCVEVKIPSTAAKQPRTCKIDTKDLSAEFVRKCCCSHDIILWFQQEYVIGEDGKFRCDKPVCLSYEDEFYRYNITLQPSFYAPPASKPLPIEEGKSTYCNSCTRRGLTSHTPTPYAYTNVGRPYSGGRASPK